MLALGDDLTLEHQAIWGAEASDPMKKIGAKGYWAQKMTRSSLAKCLRPNASVLPTL